jgi:hypothetical protein
MLKLSNLLKRKRVSLASGIKFLYSIIPSRRTPSILVMPNLLSFAHQLTRLGNGLSLPALCFVIP